MESAPDAAAGIQKKSYEMTAGKTISYENRKGDLWEN
jgi:hypothetical protein